MFIIPSTSMFNEATFQEKLFPSLGNVNDYVVHNYRKYADLERTCEPGGEVAHCD